MFFTFNIVIIQILCSKNIHRIITIIEKNLKNVGILRQYLNDLYTAATLSM